MRDSVKRDLAEKKGITLILVPCWWDGKQERYRPAEGLVVNADSVSSLVATIKKARQELLPDISVTADPIPEQIPKGFLEKHTDNVEGIGEPISACFLTRMNTDPTNW